MVTETQLPPCNDAEAPGQNAGTGWPGQSAAMARHSGDADPFANPRAIWHQCAQYGHIANVYAAVYTKACEGNVLAQKLYLQYTLGKPTGRREESYSGSSGFLVQPSDPQPSTPDQQPVESQTADARTAQREQWKRERKEKRKAIRAKLEKHKNGKKPQRQGNEPKDRGQSNAAPLPNGKNGNRPPLETVKTTGGPAAPTVKSDPVGDQIGGKAPIER